MATISDLATLSSAASGDLLVIRRSTTDYKIDAGLAAWTNTATTFTRSVVNAPSVLSDAAFSANMAASTTGRAYRWQYDGTLRGHINTFETENSMSLLAFDNSTGGGCFIAVQRNSNSTTPSAGYVTLHTRAGTSRHLWVDNGFLLRISSGTTAPLNGTDTSAGTVVGDQSSSLSVKDVIGTAVDGATALSHVADGAAAVRRFVYKSGAYNSEEFSGLIVDYAARYGMDRDDEHPAGKSLNVINAIGDLMIAVTDIAQRLAALEAA